MKPTTLLPLLALFLPACSDAEEPEETGYEIEDVESSRGMGGSGFGGWQDWWALNREDYLAVHQERESPSTAVNATNASATVDAGVLGQMNAAFLEAVNDSNDAEIAAAAMIALARGGGDPSESMTALSARLASSTRAESLAATSALSQLRTADSRQLLQGILTAQDSALQYFGRKKEIPLNNRAFAAYGIALQARYQADAGHKQAAATLLWDQLRADESSAADLRVACVLGLGLLDQADPGMTVSWLQEYLANEDMDEQVRAHCPVAIADALSHSGAGAAEKASATLLELLNQKRVDQSMRLGVILGLSDLASQAPGTVAEVSETMLFLGKRSRQRDEKNLAMIALGELGAVANSERREEITDFLTERLRKDTKATQPWAALGLGVMAWQMKQGGESIDALAMEELQKSFGKEKSLPLRSSLALALGLASFQSAREDLAKELQRAKDPEFQGFLALSLGMLGNHADAVQIQILMMDSARQPQLLSRTALALAASQSTQVVPALVTMLAPADGSKPRVAEQAAILAALDQVGDQHAIAEVFALAQDSKAQQSVRAAAFQTLSCILEQGAKPWADPIATDLNYFAAVETLNSEDAGILSRP